MDPGRYVLHQGWENNSALEGYSSVRDHEFRVGDSYRRYADEGYPRDGLYARSSFHRDLLEREYPPGTALWTHPRGRSYEDDYTLFRESRRHDKPYIGTYHELSALYEDRYRGIDLYQGSDKIRDNYRRLGSYHDLEGYHDYDLDRPAKFSEHDRDDFVSDEHSYRYRGTHQRRENVRERDHDLSRYDYDSDYERGKKVSRDSSWRHRESRERENDKRSLSWERDSSPHKRHERSHSREVDERQRSRSPHGRSYSRSHRESSYDDSHYERSDKRKDREDKHHAEHSSVAPSATLVVKGLSQKTTEEDLYQILAKWGPLRHVRVIKERSSGASRGFAFVDFPSVDAACSMMDEIGGDGLVVDGRKLFFEYSSKPTGSSSAQENVQKATLGNNKTFSIPCDWMCMICGCVNFARRTSCFQCNEARTDDAPAADVATSHPAPSGKRGSDTGPTHVLVVRGLDDNADEDMLRYEFSKHAPIKDLRLVRDKFTHVSRGFAFVHFHSVDDATKALEATNGTTLEKNGQILRVAFAKSIHGPGSSTTPQSSSLAAAAIEAAAFSQQYDAVGWAPKEYNPSEKQSGSESGNTGAAIGQQGGVAPQSGFVWDEASGYYYDAASGFYYDGNTGLYYDGNNGIWYSYDQQTQQYVPYVDQTQKTNSEKSTGDKVDGHNTRKIVISAPATTIKPSDKTSLPDAVQAAAAAALAAEKKEREKVKEIKLASKGSILASKKKMNNVLSMWKQRNSEGQVARVVLDDKQPPIFAEEKATTCNSSINTPKTKMKPESITDAAASVTSGDTQVKTRPIMGVIRNSGRGVIKSDTTYVSSTDDGHGNASSLSSETQSMPTPFKTDVSALSAYMLTSFTGSGKRRFSETPQQSTVQQSTVQQSTVQQSTAQKDNQSTIYRDRAAERRNLYGSSSSTVIDEIFDLVNSNREFPDRRGSLSDVGAMPFPPGVGGRTNISAPIQDYDVITVDRAIDESNVGNKMLRSMGWQEGSGLGKDGSGITAPVIAQAVEDRAGLGSRQKKSVDPRLEVHAGDSYKTLIQKKAIARFQEMS